MKNIALITGITGQDGSYLAEFLLEKGYEVHGTIRRSSVDFRERIAHLEGKPHLVFEDRPSRRSMNTDTVAESDGESGRYLEPIKRPKTVATDVIGNIHTISRK